MAIMLGEYWREAENAAIVVYVDAVRFNTTFRAYLKGTPEGMFVTSFNMMRDRHARKQRRKPLPLIREHL